MPPLGLPHLHLRTAESTNTLARELAEAGAPHGTLVTADSQIAGRGRQGRVWEAPPGHSLICSIVLHNPPQLLPLAAGVAVAQTVKSITGDSQLKWPNDVLVNGRKVAGILAEGRPAEGWAVVGIGINVAVKPGQLPPEVEAIATSLGLEPGDIQSVLTRLLGELELRVNQSDGELLDAFRELDALFGRQISWSGGSGIGAGIDGTGRLIVDGGDGVRHSLSAGEIHIGHRPV
ncbi:MAG: biotin--[acetyl-CoA-carboxylase] ligase [Solirubrobacterales bacterium]|nr:biotin--[acetyl-CoA-carboxylase] ligase [Solirubrobacterales bacterium]